MLETIMSYVITSKKIKNYDLTKTFSILFQMHCNNTIKPKLRSKPHITVGEPI